LCEGHRKKLIETRKVLDLAMTPVAIDATMKILQRQMFHDLRKNDFA